MKPSPPLTLHLGFGPGPRLLAPGAPDWVGADGTRVGWVIRDRLFLRSGDEVWVVELPDLVEEVVADPSGWVVALGNGFVRVDPATGEIDLVLVDDEADPVTTRAGVDRVLFVEVPEQRLLTLREGTPIALPDAALRARLCRPWARGHGACWVDFDTLYRMGTRVSALARANGAEALETGPDGAVLVALAEDTLLAAPGLPAARLGRKVAVESARFSGDGRLVLVADEDGVLLVDLPAARILRTWEGSLAPVGWAPGVLLWDADAGAIVDENQRVWLDGFAAVGTAVAEGLICGPGGAIWDVHDHERRVGGFTAGVFATDGNRVVHVEDERFTLLGAPPVPHAFGADSDAVSEAELDGDTLVYRTEGGKAGRVRLGDGGSVDGPVPRRHRRGLPRGVSIAPDDAPSGVRLGTHDWPLPVDGVVEVPGGWCAWNAEGMLVQLPVGPMSRRGEESPGG